MHNLIKIAGATVIAGAVALGATAPASAQPWGWGMQPHYYHHYYNRGPYPGYYGYGYDPGAAVAAGIVGGIFGAVAGTIAHSVGGGHVWRCQHTYRSYVPGLDSYMGYDGYRHACLL